jgi:hypothetical protein
MNRLAFAAAISFVASPAFAVPVTLNAVDQPGGAVISDPVEWQVMKIDAKKNKPIPTPVAVGSASILKTDLKAGHYLIVAKRGTVSIQQGLVVGSSDEVRNIVVSSANAAVKANVTAAKAAAPAVVATGTPATATAKPIAPTAAAVAMPAGPSAKLVIGMIPNSDRAEITEAIDWQVYTYTRGTTENGTMVAEKSVAMGAFTLPAGSYVVRAIYKGTQSDLVIPLGAGQSYHYTINLYAGQAKLSAVTAAGPARQQVAWQVVRQKPGADGKYQLVTSSNDVSPQLLLREGKYLVVGRAGNFWGMQPLSVIAGRITSTKVMLKQGDGAPEIVASAQ